MSMLLVMASRRLIPLSGYYSLAWIWHQAAILSIASMTRCSCPVAGLLCCLEMMPGRLVVYKNVKNRVFVVYFTFYFDLKQQPP